jgi:hypothetical protein
MRTRGLRICFATLALVTGACASTSFQSTWKAPDVTRFELAPGDRIVAMVISDQVSLRRSGEANLADVLDARGFTAVPAYTLIPDEEVQDEAKAKARIEASKAVAVVVFRALGAEKETTTTTTGGYYGGYYGAPYYGGFWGGGYYGQGWSTVYASPPVTTTRTDVHVAIETLIYDLRANKLVWAGRSKTTNPEDVEALVGELATAVAAELRREGLVKGK